MIKYRSLNELDVDSFVDDVLVNHKPWASQVPELLTGSHVFVCAHCNRDEPNRDSARVLIDKFKEEAELRGLTNQVFVTACYHTGGHNGNLIIYCQRLDGSITGHWYGYVTPYDVPELFDEHIGKGEIIERLCRGQIGASSDEAENSNDQKLPNGGENKKIKKPQENGNQRGTKRKRECRLGKGEIIERHRRGQTGASSNEAEEVSLKQNHCSKNWPRQRLGGVGRWSLALILGKAFGKIGWKLGRHRGRARRHLSSPRRP